MIDLALLTAREYEVAALYAQGHCAKEIGRRLERSHKTVETHKSRIRVKMQIRNGVDWMNFCRLFPPAMTSERAAV